MAVTAKGTPYVESSDLVANYPGVSLALANHIDGLDGGKVLQVVSVTKTDTFTVTSSTFTDVTGLSATITPISVSSKVLIMTTMVWQPDVNTCHGRLMRDSTPIMVGNSAGSRTLATFSTRLVSINDAFTTSAVFLDSPATTSATAYKIQVRHESSGSVFVNRASGDTDVAAYARLASTITVMEISA